MLKQFFKKNLAIMPESKKKFIFLLSHPIQYFSPLFQQMAKEENIDLLVLYCSDENVKGHIDKGFGVEVKWDIPLLEGYDYKFLKNNSWKPSAAKGFWGLINFEIFRILKKERGSYLVIHGWNYATNFLAVIAAKIYRVKLCLRGENPLNQELLKPKHLLLIRKIFFKYFFFKLFNYFFYIGEQNKKLYEYYGIKKRKLIFTPYAVDNDRFRAEYEKYKDKKEEIRRELGLPINKKIILTSAKYIPKKRPLDLLKAFKLLNDLNIALVFLGDGELRAEMEDFIRKNNLKNVYLTGFKNQSEVGKYFAAADIFVLPSGVGETWGLVVNEALNFKLDILVSNLAGCSYDLVDKESIFECGNIIELKDKLNNKLSKEIQIKDYRKILNKYSYKNIIENLKIIEVNK